jgi:broad specificity phosphatase PhoE
MKRLVFLRHGRKDGAMIAADQIAAIEDHGISGLNELLPGNNRIILHLGSMLPRTAQTIRAFQKYMENQGYETALLMPPEKRFGSDELFAKFTGNAEVARAAKTEGWYNAFLQFDEGFLRKVQSGLVEAIEEIFSKNQNGDLIIAIGHTPMIEFAALHYNPFLGKRTALSELTGFLFEEEGGNIVPTQKIGWQSY